MTTMRSAWQCDAQGVLVGETPVQEDPMAPGVFLLPPGCVLAAPPAFDAQSQTAIHRDGAWTVHDLPAPEAVEASVAPDDPATSTQPAAPASIPTGANRPDTNEHQVAVIVDGQWAVVDDWRGTAYWLADGSAHHITELGHTPPDGAHLSPPVPAPRSLVDAQAEKVAMLRASWQSAREQPVAFTTAAGKTDLFACDATSVANLDAMLAAHAPDQSWSPNVWLNAAGTPVTPFTWADMAGLAETIANRAKPDYPTLLAKIGEVMAACSVADVEAITW